MSILVLIAAILGIIINKGFDGIKEHSVRGFLLAICGFIIQLGIFNRFFASSRFEFLTPYLYILSLVMLLIFVALNLNYTGMKIIFVGSILNFVAIVSNGGYMPQYLDKLSIAKEFKKIELLKQFGHYYNGILGNEHTKFKLLTDIFAISSPEFLASVYSIGDFIIIFGLIVFIFEFTKKNKNTGEA